MVSDEHYCSPAVITKCCLNVHIASTKLVIVHQFMLSQLNPVSLVFWCQANLYYGQLPRWPCIDLLVLTAQDQGGRNTVSGIPSDSQDDRLFNYGLQVLQLEVM